VLFFEEELDGSDQLDPARVFGFLAQPIFSGRSDASTREIDPACPSGESRTSTQLAGCQSRDDHRSNASANLKGSI